jgi:hypothetical protein
MSAFDGRPELKSKLLQSLGPIPAVNVFSVLQMKSANRQGAARTTGSYINDLLPPRTQTDGPTMGIPASLVRQASDFEETLLSQSAKLAWARAFIESIRPGAELGDVSRQLGCFKFAQAFPAKAQYLTEEQIEAVNLVRQLTEQKSTSVESWREALHKTTDGILVSEGSAPRSAEGMTEWRTLAAVTQSSVSRMSDAEVNKHIDSIAWMATELAYALLDPWWKNDAAAVKNYSQKLLTLLRSA